MNYWRAAIALVLGAFLLWRNLSGGLLCLRPAFMRVRRADGSPAIDAALFDDMERELAPLGFRRLGVHYEQPPLRRPVLTYDFVHDADRTFASAYVHAGEAHLYLLTRFDDDAFVLTADHKRAGAEREGQYLAGGLPGAGPEQLLAAHRRRVERLRAAGREPLADLSVEARIAAAQAWFAGVGARELRLRHANSFLLAAMAAFFVVSVLVALARAAS